MLSPHPTLPVSEPYPTVLKAYYWIYSQGSPLAEIRGWDARDQTWNGHVHGKHLTHYTITQTYNLQFAKEKQETLLKIKRGFSEYLQFVRSSW